MCFYIEIPDPGQQHCVPDTYVAVWHNTYLTASRRQMQQTLVSSSTKQLSTSCKTDHRVNMVFQWYSEILYRQMQENKWDKKDKKEIKKETTHGNLLRKITHSHIHLQSRKGTQVQEVKEKEIQTKKKKKEKM